jgi:hypothetical protein
VISTPYLYASEALAEGRGLLAEFQDPRSFARCITMLLDNGALREQCESSAFDYGRAMSWRNVGARYADLFRTVTGAVPDAAKVVGLVEGRTVGVERVEASTRDAVASAGTKSREAM